MNPVSHRIDTFLDALHESYTSQLHPPPIHIGGRQRKRRMKSRRRQHQQQKNRIYTIAKPKQKKQQTKLDNISGLENKMYTYLSKHKYNHQTKKRMNQ